MIHTFRNSIEAYDASQTNDDIKHGDTLVVESETAVAVLFHAWPLAVTLSQGVFDGFTSWSEFAAANEIADDDPFIAGIQEAATQAVLHNFALRGDLPWENI